MAFSLRAHVRHASYIAAVAFLPLLAGCSDGPTESSVAGQDPHVTASVNGSPWEANYEVPLVIGDVYPARDRAEVVGLEISPSFAGRQVTLTIEDFDGPGTYALGARSTGGSWGWYVTSPDVRAEGAVRMTTDRHYETGASGGTVIVTSYDASTGRIAGTFSFTAANVDDANDVVTVANGSFKGRLYIDRR